MIWLVSLPPDELTGSLYHAASYFEEGVKIVMVFYSWKINTHMYMYWYGVHTCVYSWKINIHMSMYWYGVYSWNINTHMYMYCYGVASL